MLRKAWFFVLCIFCLCSNNTYSQDNQHIEQLINTLKFSEKQGLNLAVDNLGNNWLRGEFEAQHIYSPLTFRIPSVRMMDYDMYIYNHHRLVKLQPNVDNNDNRLQTRFPQFHVVTDSVTYYINLKHAPLEQFEIQIGNRSQVAQLEAKAFQHIGLYYGLAIMAIILNVVFFALFKDYKFLLYAFLQLSICMSIMYEDGIFYYLSWGKAKMNVFLVWNVPSGAVLAYLFTYYFIKDNRIFKRLKTYIWSLFMVIFTCALLYTLTRVHLIYVLVNTMSLVPVLIAFCIAISHIKEDIYARFICFSLGIMLFISIGYSLHKTFDAQFFTIFNINTFRLFSALDMITITFAIMYRVHELLQENNYYKQEITKHLLNVAQQNNISTLKKVHDKNPKTTVASLIETVKFDHNLTNREAEVLACIWKGMSNTEISTSLFISLNTTKYHVGNLYTKLAINSRDQALLFKPTNII